MNTCGLRHRNHIWKAVEVDNMAWFRLPGDMRRVVMIHEQRKFLTKFMIKGVRCSIGTNFFP